MDKKFKFKCGCEFPIVNGKIDFIPEISILPLTCEATWDLISAGNTKGVFQLESSLGQSLAAKLKPRSIEHLAALSAIIRPGCSEAFRDGKSVTQHYIDRKNGMEEVTYFHPALKAALQSTYGEMIYQEQAMQIARDIAGFSMQEADDLRKAIGKKKADLMAKVKIKFLEGCEKLGIVNGEEAEEIFGWIEKSQRYSFNKSHAVSYAYNGYLSAYGKIHLVKPFFTSYLRYGQFKQNPHEEIYSLVTNAKNMDVNVLGPDIRMMNPYFKLINGKIYFGLADIKGVGEASLRDIEQKMQSIEEVVGRPKEQWNWLEFLILFSPKLNGKKTMEALILSGSLQYFGMSRHKLLYEYDIYTSLSPKETDYINRRFMLYEFDESGNRTNKKHNYQTLRDILVDILEAPTGKNGACHDKRRVKKVEELLAAYDNPPNELKDNPKWIADKEKELFGIAINCTAVDACNTEIANCTCKDFNNGFKAKDILVACQIDGVRETKTKNGKNPGSLMAYLSISDSTGSLETVIVFPKEWSEYKGMVIEGNTVVIHGFRKENSFIVRKIMQL